MTQSTKTRKIRPERWLPSVGLLAVLSISLWLAWNAWEGPATTHDLKITGGRLPGPKQRLAEVLARESSRLGVQFTLRDCSGSVESLDQVNDGLVDVALVQGGLDSKRWTNVRQIAALHVEPLQLVVRREIFAEVAANLQALKGRTVNLGEAGSGSEILARDVLAFVGLRAGSPGVPGDYESLPLSHRQLQEIKTREQLPDAVITVSSLPTPMVRRLVATFGYRLIPLPFGEAFALEDLIPDDGPSEVVPERVRAVVDKVHLHETQIPAFTYGVEPAMPAAPLPTFGARVLVVTHRDTSRKAVNRLLESIFLTDFSEVARPRLETSLLDLPPEFPLHPGTVEFMQRNKPLIVGDAVDFLEKTSSLTGAILGGLFVSWQWARRRYRRRRELGFESYLRKVTAIEQEALKYELAAQLDLAALLALQADLGGLKNEAMERFTLGELEGEGLMSGFLTHANDARDYLARLILHARTTIEKQARRQGLSPDAAWELAIGDHSPSPAEPDQSRDLPSEGAVL
jgi:TRAP-type uncharacterized transport system substrate-binding protein